MTNATEEAGTPDLPRTPGHTEQQQAQSKRQQRWSQDPREPEPIGNPAKEQTLPDGRERIDGKERTQRAKASRHDIGFQKRKDPRLREKEHPRHQPERDEIGLAQRRTKR